MTLVLVGGVQFARFPPCPACRASLPSRLIPES